MENLTSEELQITQKTLEKLIVSEINDPMTDYNKVNKYLKIVKKLIL